MISSKSLKTTVSSLALLSCTAVSSHAVVLFTDNFDVTGPSFSSPPDNTGIGPNFDAANPGRQGGTLATPTLGYLFSGNVQVGNTTTLAIAPGSALGDEMLVSGTATVNFNFATIGTPIEINFNGLPDFNNGNQDNWFSFTVGDVGDGRFVNAAGLDFGMLFRANGGTQYFVDSAATTGTAGPAVGLNTWSTYKIILSDAAGTGSAFGTGSSRVDYYQNGALLGTATLGSPLTADQGYIGFGTSSISGIDNLSIASVPEPSAMMACLGSVAGFALLRRRK